MSQFFLGSPLASSLSKIFTFLLSPLPSLPLSYMKVDVYILLSTGIYAEGHMYVCIKLECKY